MQSAGCKLVGDSPAFTAVRDFICRFAMCDVPVLITGETGTGKEQVARALHYLSARRDRPFVPINCGALPDSLFENELFGHRRGAFTGAHQAQKGLIAQCQGGTLLLDEIDSLSPKGQVALLRFLQDRKYRPLGGEQICTADVRVLAAANADLWLAVRNGQFRQDLLFRLDIVSIAVPSLRERPGDILLLARHFLRSFAEAYGRQAPVIEPSAEDELLRYHWQGNVRELENAMHRALLLADGTRIAAPIDFGTRSKGAPAMLAAAPAEQFVGGLSAARQRVASEFERRYLLWVLAEANGNVSAAARRAGTERRHLGRLIRRHGIDAAAFRGDSIAASALDP